jgi:hydrogenase maturation factor
VTGRVTELLGQGMDTVEVGGLAESVSVKLVDAHGNLLLVRARVAIGKLR